MPLWQRALFSCDTVIEFDGRLGAAGIVLFRHIVLRCALTASLETFFVDTVDAGDDYQPYYLPIVVIGSDSLHEYDQDTKRFGESALIRNELAIPGSTVGVNGTQ